jgi:hypothetical protein
MFCFCQGSTTSTPHRVLNDDGDVIADICPTGSYCDEGSVMPSSCGPGFFSSSTGNSNSSYCFLCTPGYYCPNATTSFPIPCPEGYYCPLGSSYYELLCDEGYMCPERSYSPQVMTCTSSPSTYLTALSRRRVMKAPTNHWSVRAIVRCVPRDRSVCAAAATQKIVRGDITAPKELYTPTSSSALMAPSVIPRELNHYHSAALAPPGSTVTVLVLAFPLAHVRPDTFVAAAPRWPPLTRATVST